VGNLFSGIAFLISGVLVYAHNTEMHDPAGEITFSRMLGMEVIGSTETVALLLGIGMFFLGLGAFRWLTDQALLADQDAESGSAEVGANEPKDAS
jgi:hypothetical protein